MTKYSTQYALNLYLDMCIFKCVCASALNYKSKKDKIQFGF